MNTPPHLGCRILDVGFENSAAAPQAVTNSKARLLSDTPRQAETPAPQAPSSDKSKIKHPKSKMEMPFPKGISVPAAAHALQLSVATVRRMIAAGQLVAWKPRGAAGRKWLVDEVSLAATQSVMIQAARQRCAPAQNEMLQGVFEF